MVKQSMRSKPFRGVSKQENSLENLGEDKKQESGNEYRTLISKKEKKDWMELPLFKKWSQRKLATAILLGPPWDPIKNASIEKKIIWMPPMNDMLFR